MIDHADPVFRTWLRDMLGAEDVTIVFTKNNGDERRMKCTLRTEVISNYVKKGDRERGDSDSLSVWDLEKDAWRSFRYDTIKEINFTIGSAANAES